MPNNYTELSENIFVLLSAPNFEISGAQLGAMEKSAADCGVPWLTAAVSALCAWLRDDREKADALIKKGMFMDGGGVSLFFLLIMRRLGRAGAAAAWSRRYLDIQDPNRLDVNAFVVADALREGLFGENAAQNGADGAAAWYGQLLAQAGFIERQRAAFTEFFKSKMAKIKDNDYPTLSSAVTNWEALKGSQAWLLACQDICAQLAGVVSSQPPSKPALEKKLDDIFAGLLNCSGKEAAARDELSGAAPGESGSDDSVFNESESALKDGGKAAIDLSVSMTGLITDPDNTPGGNMISGGARKLLLALSKGALIDEYNRFDARMEAQKPMHVQIRIADWTNALSSSNGIGQLRDDLLAHIRRQRDAKLGEVRISTFQWIALIAGAVLLLLGLPALNPLFISISLVPILYWVYARIETYRRVSGLKDYYARHEAETLSVFDKFASELERFASSVERYESMRVGDADQKIEDCLRGI